MDRTLIRSILKWNVNSNKIALWLDWNVQIWRMHVVAAFRFGQWNVTECLNTVQTVSNHARHALNFPFLFHMRNETYTLPFPPSTRSIITSVLQCSSNLDYQLMWKINRTDKSASADLQSSEKDKITTTSRQSSYSSSLYICSRSLKLYMDIPQSLICLSMYE